MDRRESCCWSCCLHSDAVPMVTNCGCSLTGNEDFVSSSIFYRSWHRRILAFSSLYLLTGSQPIHGDWTTRPCVLGFAFSANRGGKTIFQSDLTFLRVDNSKSCWGWNLPCTVHAERLELGRRQPFTLQRSRHHVRHGWSCESCWHSLEILLVCPLAALGRLSKGPSVTWLTCQLAFNGRDTWQEGGVGSCRTWLIVDKFSLATKCVLVKVTILHNAGTGQILAKK